MLNCGRCGLTNRPYDTNCSLCKNPLQSHETATAKRNEWDALSPRLREEQEQFFDRMRKSVEGHLQWLRRHRLTHALLGALSLSLLMNGSAFFASIPSIPIDLIIGAGAGLLLNHLRGGSWRGLGLFLVAAVLSVILRLPFLNVEVYLEGYWFFTCFALLAVTGVGYGMGLKLDYEHSDHAVTG